MSSIYTSLAILIGNICITRYCKIERKIFKFLVVSNLKIVNKLQRINFIFPIQPKNVLDFW